MKKSAIVSVCLLLVVCLVSLTGCELSIKRNRITAENTLPEGGKANTEAPAYDFTAIVEVTDENGEVIGTASVELSDEEKNANKSFYDASANGVSGGVNKERVKDDYQQDDNEVLKSKKYVITGRITNKDGATNEYRAARNGSQYCAISNYNGKQVGLIIDYLNIYVIDPGTRSYFAVPKSLVEQYSEDDDDILNVVNGKALEAKKEVTSENEEDVDGVTMKVVKYGDGSADYYCGTALIKSLTTEGSVLYYDSISPTVSKGMFVPPIGYTFKPLTVESVSELADSVGAVNE